MKVGNIQNNTLRRIGLVGLMPVAYLFSLVMAIHELNKDAVSTFKSLWQAPDR